MEACNNQSCAIHFDGKEGEIKSFTNETLTKIFDVRGQWLNLCAMMSVDNVKKSETH